MFYETLSHIEHVSDNVLLYLYQSILEIAEEISAGRKDSAQDKIKKMGEILMMIRQQEEMERQREGNPDDLLKNM
jgi:hypothetical protein